MKVVEIVNYLLNMPSNKAFLNFASFTSRPSSSNSCAHSVLDRGVRSTELLEVSTRPSLVALPTHSHNNTSIHSISFTF